MRILNDILSWFMKRRMERIEHFKAFPLEVQNQVFHELIDAAKRTEWGTKHGYSNIQTIREFQERVPVSSYEVLFPYIERVLKGEQNVLWPSDIEWFSKSSGTTNARSKFLPMSPESLEDCHYRGGKDMMTLFVQNRPETAVFDGKALSIGGSLQPNPHNIDLMAGDVSAIIMKNLPAWGEYMRTPPIEVALLDNWEEKVARMAEITRLENVTSILGVPTWVVILMDRIMEKNRVSSMLDIWPNFEVFVHGAVAFQPYRELFQTKYFPSKAVNYLEIYNASEGCFAIQDDLSKPGEMLLMLDYGVFYEFVPAEKADQEHPDALTLDQVQLDTNYALIISTNAGLWRYKIGDTIKFTCLNPFRVKVSGRTKHFINAFGEELIVDNADRAITSACEATGAVLSEYTAGPIYMDNGTRGRHEWIIEFSEAPADRSLFEHILDKTLREVNSDYDAKRRRDLALVRPIVHHVPNGTFYNWMARRGKLGGQHKVPRLSNSREYLDDILTVIQT